MPLPPGCTLTVELSKCLMDYSVDVSMRAVVPPHALGPNYDEVFQAGVKVHSDMWYDYNLPQLGHPGFQQAFMHTPAGMQLQGHLSHEFDRHYEEDFVTLLPNRFELAKVIAAAEEEFSAGATPQMLADYILLKLSEKVQVIKPATMIAADHQMHVMAVSDPHIPNFLKSMAMTTGGASQDLLFAGSFAATAYLRYIADKNIQEIKG